MNRGQDMHCEFKPIDFIPYTVAPDEVFKYITPDIIPGVKPYYMISNYGRIYMRFSRIPWMSLTLDTKGYWMASLITDNGPLLVRVHRIVKLAFDYIPGCENLVVDHVDGNRRNPYLGNLEWVTFGENIRRGIQMSKKNGSLPPQITPPYIINDMDFIRNMKDQIKQEKEEKKSMPVTYTQKTFNDLKSNFNCQSNSTRNSARSSHTAEEVHAICKMLQDGYTMSYIATKLQIKKSYVAAVYHGQARPDISCKYDFSKYGTIAYHDKWVFTPEQVHAICDYMSKNRMEDAPSRRMYIKHMFANLNIEYSDNKYSAVLDIYKGRGYTSVSKNYNILK